MAGGDPGMTADVTIGELSRGLTLLREEQRSGLDSLQRKLDSLVSSSIFDSERARVDEKFSILAQDLMEERQTRAKQDEMFETKIQKVADDAQKSIDKLVATQRWIVVSILIPVGLFLGNLWLNLKG